MKQKKLLLWYLTSGKYPGNKGVLNLQYLRRIDLERVKQLLYNASE